METVAGWKERRDRSRRFRGGIQESEGKECSVRCGRNRESGLPNGCSPGPRRKQNHHPQTKMITEVAFVAIAVTDAERARKFYQDLLGLKPSLTAMEGMWVEYEIAGTTIGV